MLKRPGSKSNTTKNQDETESLDDMLTHIKDKEDEEIDSAWQELSSRQKQSLWNRFEHTGNLMALRNNAKPPALGGEGTKRP